MLFLALTSNNRCHLATCCAIVSGLLLLAGCSNEAVRQPIFGNITSRHPVLAVTFQPEGETKGPAVTTDVISGSYRFTNEDGPVPGTHEVIFHLDVPKAPAFAPVPKTTDKVPQLMTRRLPANSLPPTIQIEVPSSGSLQLDLIVPDSKP
ncbi:hypothetical protein NA78x_001666 [Anatilimnocola sp. NA78]|uniref:hypothetical protein n=1 Tax=Anatilimnocola sp. NA78 TaxID=3415683 RepID=UPI003CE50B6F